jgi:alpha-methylacyl-CoA racemase
VSLPTTAHRSGPLVGVRALELGGIGPGPFCGMVLGDLGAEVIRVDRAADAGSAPRHPVLHRGRRSLALDLKRSAGVEVALRLVGGSDALVEGFRPGVAERLGLGPGACLAHNPRLVYGRMTGWGQEGPLAQEPGHDLNYIGLAGALGAIGPADGDPVVPLNLVGDMGGGGLLLATGILAGLLHARQTGEGQVVDAAMTDGTAIMLAIVLDLVSQGLWEDRRGVNLLDGGAPFYRTYRCADSGHIAVASLEPELYTALVRVLGLADDPTFSSQHDRAAWPPMAARLSEIFGTRSRDEWAAVFAGEGAGVTAVLRLGEAPAHPHNVARGTYATDAQGVVQPGVAPRLLATPGAVARPAPRIGEDTEAILAEAGYAPAAIAELRREGVVGTP